MPDHRSVPPGISTEFLHLFKFELFVKMDGSCVEFGDSQAKSCLLIFSSMLFRMNEQNS